MTWADTLTAHASDADYRKSTDPTEAPKHFIDIDYYPEFVSTGTIPQDFDSIVAIHGYSFVIDHRNSSVGYLKYNRFSSGSF